MNRSENSYDCISLTEERNKKTSRLEVVRKPVFLKALLQFPDDFTALSFLTTHIQVSLVNRLRLQSNL